MKSFEFYSPTKVIFGKDAELKTAEEIKEFGGSRVMIVYGGGSVVKSGLLEKIQQMLKNNNLEFTVLGGVQPNPKLLLARSGVEQAIKFGADFILAVGGGSVIDTAKGIALGAANPQTDIWTFWSNKAVAE
jgi:alcohol dehydrogenase YqhD (iron-dependent ADH family)